MFVTRRIRSSLRLVQAADQLHCTPTALSSTECTDLTPKPFQPALKSGRRTTGMAEEAK